MAISDRIMDRLQEIGMSQKEFSQKTGIAQSTISEWKSKGNNPTAEKILPICNVLGVSPEWVLSGVEVGGRNNDKFEFYIVDKKSDVGQIVEKINSMNKDQIIRLLGYVAGITEAVKRG